MTLDKIRNVAVIAHVDHGKTTLIDALLKQSQLFRENQAEMQQDLLMDSNELERERGITILAKNCAIEYQDYKINIIDTPGHADFSGEVERTLGMADSAILIVDAAEGPMPQTRFVLKKALELGLKVAVVINKIDKPLANSQETISKLEDLFLELATTEDQLHFPILYAIARDGLVFDNLPEDVNNPGDSSVEPLLKLITEQLPAPKDKPDQPYRLLVSALDYDPHLGQLVIGRLESGNLKTGDPIVLLGQESKPKSDQIGKVFVSQGMGRIEVNQASAGDIVTLAVSKPVTIGATLTHPDFLEKIPAPTIGEPTVHITIKPNSSPFTGNEGEFTTSRQIEDRLNKELETNISLKIEKRGDAFVVSGRGELHLSILLETLRREGFELEVGKPEVVIKEIEAVKHEPVEEVVILVDDEFVGVINQEMGKRLAKLQRMQPLQDGQTEFVYHAPTRVLLGLRSLLLTATKGTAIINSQFLDFAPLGKALPQMRKGVLIASETGEASAYGLQISQARGQNFVNPGTKVYQGMIVGQNAKSEDIEINVCKGKKLTNIRSKSSDGVIQLAPAVELSLEECLDFLEADELLEITPKNLRLRKRYLSEHERRKFNRQQASGG